MVLAVLDDLFHALLPPRCAACRTKGSILCAPCERAMRAAPVAPPPSPLAWWTACFAYEGVAREAVARAKYRGERATLRVLAVPLARAAARVPAPVDLVTWAPASSARFAGTGVDHAEVLAREVARVRGWSCARLLERRAGGAPQTGRAAAVRRAGPLLRATRRVDGLNILVIDDVATTGGTLAATARTLRAHGANCVMAATVARTPRPGRGVPERTYTSHSQLV